MRCNPEECAINYWLVGCRCERELDRRYAIRHGLGAIGPAAGCFLPPCPTCEGRGVYDSHPIPPDKGPAMEFECYVCNGSGNAPGMAEAWTVRSCIDAAGNHTCWDVCLPSQPDGRGVGVVASVIGDKQTAELIAVAPRIAAALKVAATRFRFLAEMQRAADRPESKGNASILERHADECLAAIAKTDGDA